MPARKGLLAPQNTFLDTIANRFDGTHSNFVLGNAKVAKTYPIVYCSDGFCELTGYSRAQIMQKSCACDFLYGQKTDVQHRQAITEALRIHQEFKVELILYKNSGTPFWCLLDIVPILDEKHEVVLFLCSHKDITKEKLHQHQQQLLAELHAQKQHQLDHQNLTAGLKRDSSEQQLHPQTSQELKKAGQQLENGEPGALLPMEKLEDADEAQLAAIANQNALLSMDEFDLGDEEGEENEFPDGDDSEDHDKNTTNQYSRRRSRAVLYQLSGHYGYGRRSVNMKSKLKLNNRMNIPEYKTTTIEKQRFILSHYGVGKSCWDWLILIVSFYVAIVVPYNATFKPIAIKDPVSNDQSKCRTDFIDILVEVVFVIDVILNFRTTFVNRKGEVVTRPRIICKHYIRGWFVVDACAALPFDLLCLINIGSQSRLDLNLLKLIRLLRLARLLQKMDRYSQYSYIILTLLMLIFSLLAHWCACIWYVIATEEISHNEPSWKIGWLYQLSDKLNYSVVNTSDMVSAYVTALYFTTSSLTSVGFGNVSANTNAEKIFSIVIMLIGALMHAVVFGNVTALIRVMYARRSNYQTRLRDLKDFFRLHQLPKDLQQRMSDYFQTTWSLNHGIETYEILKDFPEELRGDVSLHLHREVLSLPIFETAPQGFLKSLARHIESKFCCPTEYLIHRGDALNYLYLVCNGSMEVLQDNMVVAILGKGDLVGYDVIATQEHNQFSLGSKTLLTGANAHIGLVKSGSDLKALTYCDLKCIHISGLLEVLQFYPEFSDTFHSEIIHDLSFNLRDTTHEDLNTDDDEGDEEDDDDDEDGADAAGARDDEPGAPGDNSALVSPSEEAPLSNYKSQQADDIGHLYRSITQSGGENRIGRYDHDDDDDELVEEEPDDDEELVEEEEEEEEGEEEGEDSEGAGRNNNRRHGGGGGDKDDGPGGSSAHSRGFDSSDDDDEGGLGGNGGRGGGDEASSTSRLLNNMERSGGASERRGMPVSPSDEPLVCPGQQEIRRRKQVAQDDWHSSHSYDGLADSKRAASQQHRRISKNKSDDTVLGAIKGGAQAAACLRPAIGGNQRNPSQLGLAQRKPPLSFDLSRNTTAIVDRRRRSAGCIARPLLLGCQGGVSGPGPGRRANHSSSLIHINEEERPLRGCPRGLKQVRPKSAAKVARREARLQHESSVKSADSFTQGSNQITTFGRDFKNIDERISSISTSVSEMKSELRYELNQFRTTMQQLMLLVDKQLTTGSKKNNHHLVSNSQPAINFVHSTSSLSLPRRRRKEKEREKQPLRDSQQALLSQGAAQSVPTTLSRSLSATSLPAGQFAVLSLSPVAPRDAFRVAWRRHQAPARLNRPQDGRSVSNASADDEQQPAAKLSPQTGIGSLGAAGVAQAPNQSASLRGRLVAQSRFVLLTQDNNNNQTIPRQQFLTSAAALGAQQTARPASQCSSSPLALTQASSGANLNQASDNDSGRSTSSVNSSTYLQQKSHQLVNVEQMANQNLKQHIVENPIQSEVAPSIGRGPHKPFNGGGRLAKMLLTNVGNHNGANVDDDDDDDDEEHHTRSYTITDINDDSSMNLQVNSKLSD